MYLPDLNRLRTPGATFPDASGPDDGAEYVLEPHPAGDVVLPTGQVVGCDPLVFADAEPFTVTVPPGTYPLRAWVAVLRQGGAEWRRYTAALELVIRDEPAARWEPALLPGQSTGELEEDAFFGYPVDAGTGTLADATAVAALGEWDYERVEDAYIPAQIPDAPVPGGPLGAVTDEATGANVIVVTSGMGDGVYPTFVGYTAAGDVASYLTDFLVVAQD